MTTHKGWVKSRGRMEYRGMKTSGEKRKRKENEYALGSPHGAVSASFPGIVRQLVIWRDAYGTR
jgi:hypothetical protein